MTKCALITGITGQDGSYLAELLLKKGYEVHGVMRRSSSFNTVRIDHLYQDPHESDVRLHLHHGDLTDGSAIARLIRQLRPEEIYNLGAQSHVAVSFHQPEYTGDVDALGVVRLLEAIREADVPCKLYQAGTSEMFGDAPAPQSEDSEFRPRSPYKLYQAGTSEMFGDAPAPQSEDSEFRPRSPYAVAKLYGFHMIRNYREAYGMFAVTGILFNHESPRRGETFVTRKITRAVAAIVAGRQDTLFLGNLDSIRDWGHARDYVEAMWMMLQQDEPRDYVVGMGESHTVREFCRLAFGHVGLEWEPFVEVDPAYYRPTEVENLHADPMRATTELGWKPQTSFPELVEEMVEADLVEHGLSLDEARARVAEQFGREQRRG